MSNAGNADEELTPAERRLSEHLEVLRDNPPLVGPYLIARILGRARWQGAVRDQLLFMGAISGALAESLGLLLRPPVGDR